MEPVAQQPRTAPCTAAVQVPLEQAVRVAANHTWMRVGFAIGLITFAMGTLWVQRETDLANGPWFALYLGGCLLITAFAIRWHRAATAMMARTTVVDAHGHALGPADEVANAEIERRFAPLKFAGGVWYVIVVAVAVILPGATITWWGLVLATTAALLTWQRLRTVRDREAAAGIDSWHAGHKSHYARQVVGDDAPIPTHRPRDRRGAARRRR